jgi:hypothetical protein
MDSMSEPLTVEQCTQVRVLYSKHPVTTRLCDTVDALRRQLTEDKAKCEDVKRKLETCYWAGTQIEAAVKPQGDEFIFEAAIRTVQERDALLADNAALAAALRMMWNWQGEIQELMPDALSQQVILALAQHEATK